MQYPKFLIRYSKVRIFWEGHKICEIFPLLVLQSKVRGRFRKILWPSQNIWTLWNIFVFRNLCQPKRKTKNGMKSSFMNKINPVNSWCVPRFSCFHRFSTTQQKDDLSLYLKVFKSTLLSNKSHFYKLQTLR